MSAGMFHNEKLHPRFSERDRFSESKAATGLDQAILASRFESLGNDCEFGFFQRYCGADTLGLFRFSNPHHSVILDGIVSNFEDFGKSLEVELDQQQPRREWIIVDRARNLREHTFIWEGEQSEEAVRMSSLTRSRYLQRMMIDNMRTADKIYVIKSGEGHLTEKACLAISQALRQRGPNWLLWVEPGPIIGRVDQLAPGLLRGTIDRLTVQGDGTEPSFAAWLAILTEAYALTKLSRS